MGALTVSKFGLASAPKTGVERGVYRLKNKGIGESAELYGKIGALVKIALDNAGEKQRAKLQSGLENRHFKKIKIDEYGVEFVKENGNAVKILIPESARDPIGEIFTDRIRCLNLRLHTIDKMVDQVVEETNFKKVLYLYSSGGGGHKSAKDAIRDNRLPKLQADIKEALIQKHGKEKGEEMFKFYFPNYQAFVDYALAKGLLEEKDVLLDFVGYVGKKGAESWDEAQKKGDVEKQESLAGKQKLSSVVFAPMVFVRTLLTLIRYKPEKIVSTQAICNDAIISAIGIYNTFFKPSGRKEMKLHLYMTDMPTELSDHFFGTIRSMFKGQKELLVLHAPKANTDFDWEVKVGLKKGQYKELKNMELPIRPAFVQAVKKFQDSPFDPKKLQIKITCKEEREMLEQVIGEKAIAGAKSEGTQFVDYTLGRNDEAHYIMLGSQPTKSAIFAYIDQYIHRAAENSGKPLHLFLFAGKFEKDKKAKDCLYKEISEYLLRKKASGVLPKNLKIVPLSFQDADQMVGFFARCHSITRSGGATCMELMVMEEVSKAIKESGQNPGYAPPKRYVHSQLVDGRNAEESIPLWERGNFYFMRDLCGAKVVTPETLLGALQDSSGQKKTGAKSKTESIANTLFEKDSPLLNPLIVEKIQRILPVSQDPMS